MVERGPGVFIEIGLGEQRRRGYGPAYPFKEGDFYIGVDLPHEFRQPVYDEEEDKMVDPPSPTILGSMEAVRRQQLQLEEQHAGFAALSPLHRRMFANHELEMFAQERGIQFSSVYADGRELPFPDNSALGVLLSNVIGFDILTDTDRDQLLSEARRVAGPLGHVVLNEGYTPDVARSYLSQSNWPYTEVDPYLPAGYHTAAEYHLPDEVDLPAAIFYIHPPSEHSNVIPIR